MEFSSASHLFNDDSYENLKIYPNLILDPFLLRSKKRFIQGIIIRNMQMKKPEVPHLASNEHLKGFEKRLYKSKSFTLIGKLYLPKNNESKYLY